MKRVVAILRSIAREPAHRQVLHRRFNMQEQRKIATSAFMSRGCSVAAREFCGAKFTRTFTVGAGLRLASVRLPVDRRLLLERLALEAAIVLGGNHQRQLLSLPAGTHRYPVGRANPLAAVANQEIDMILALPMS